jgi:hypothetical protein
MKYRALKTVALFIALSVIAVAQDLASFEKRITLKKLDNGLTVIICERPGAPVFSFNTHVDAGSVQDPMGQTGLARMFALPTMRRRKSHWRGSRQLTLLTLSSATNESVGTSRS